MGRDCTGWKATRLTRLVCPVRAGAATPVSRLRTTTLRSMPPVATCRARARKYSRTRGGVEEWDGGQCYQLLAGVEVEAQDAGLARRVGRVAGRRVERLDLLLRGSLLGHRALLPLGGKPVPPEAQRFVVWGGVHGRVDARVEEGGGTHCLETDRSLCLTCSEIPAPPSTSIPSALAPAHPRSAMDGHTTHSREGV